MTAVSIAFYYKYISQNKQNYIIENFYSEKSGDRATAFYNLPQMNNVWMREMNRSTNEFITTNNNE